MSFETGITGNVEYGEGDCFPPVDESKREYKKFSGDIYIIVKSELDSLGDGDFNQLKEKSIKKKLKKGKLCVDLAPNTYIVMPEDLYRYSEENTITVTEGELTNKNFQFWKCTSH